VPKQREPSRRRRTTLAMMRAPEVTRVPAITDPPPADVRDQVDAYKDALADVVPPKRSDNLLIGTWNVRAFNRLTTE